MRSKKNGKSEKIFLRTTSLKRKRYKKSAAPAKQIQGMNRISIIHPTNFYSNISTSQIRFSSSCYHYGIGLVKSQRGWNDHNKSNSPPTTSINIWNHSKKNFSTALSDLQSVLQKKKHFLEDRLQQYQDLYEQQKRTQRQRQSIIDEQLKQEEPTHHRSFAKIRYLPTFPEQFPPTNIATLDVSVCSL
ncbi:hypothetical protein RFI_01395 [Reticulomyxa filosa]|uniref:Uncharacterized protein n=1 Tax=Reticulomyxa filosa TaxID=46433 RepID=X6PBW1_RETFI|nr:hypothetical protein RFI_01395 [Reticulomyxa filosa]|eukprot:ETO35666.1 hypothetical protein RFI_01395 [Reticulomyxa filosa]